MIILFQYLSLELEDEIKLAVVQTISEDQQLLRLEKRSLAACVPLGAMASGSREGLHDMEIFTAPVKLTAILYDGGE